MNQFTEKYKTFSNADLKKIIDNPTDAEVGAVEAAKIELKDRLRLNDGGLTDPAPNIKKSSPATNWIIAIISIVFALSFLYRIDTPFGLLTLVINESSISGVILDLIHFALWTMLPIAVYLFWKREKRGWILLCVFFANTTLNNIVSFSRELRQPGVANAFINSFFVAVVEFHALDIITYSACLWLICKSSVRLIYKVDRRLTLICIGLGAIITAVIWLTLVFKYQR